MMAAPITGGGSGQWAYLGSGAGRNNQEEPVDDFIAGMPKCELHLHIEGTLEPELKFALAARNGVELPYATVEEARAAYTFDSLTSFLVGYSESMQVLLNEP